MPPSASCRPARSTTLVKPENKATLTKILTYHVVAGKHDASDLTDGKKLTTVEGEVLTVKKADGKTWIVDRRGRHQSLVRSPTSASRTA